MDKDSDAVDIHRTTFGECDQLDITKLEPKNLVEHQILASCYSPERGEFPIHYSTCSECKSDIPDHIGFRWEKMTVAQAKEEWEEFKIGWK